MCVYLCLLLVYYNVDEGTDAHLEVTLASELTLLLNLPQFYV